MYRSTRNYENIQKMYFDPVGQYDLPQIMRMETIPDVEFINFNEALKEKHPENKGVHFFIDDYRFQRVWQDVERYTEVLKKFKFVCTPDFSMYTDFPMAMSIYNRYRSQWLGCYWQKHGISVIPTVCWSSPDTLEWAFDGIPKGGVIACSSVGTQKIKKIKAEFADACTEMLNRIEPKAIVWHGDVPPEIDFGDVQIVKVSAFADKWNKPQGTVEYGGINFPVEMLEAVR